MFVFANCQSTPNRLSFYAKYLWTIKNKVIKIAPTKQWCHIQKSNNSKNIVDNKTVEHNKIVVLNE